MTSKAKLEGTLRLSAGFGTLDSRSLNIRSLSESYQSLAPEHALQVDESAIHLGRRKVKPDDSRNVGEWIATHFSQECNTPKPVPALEEARLVDDVLVRAGAAVGHRLVLTQ